MEFFTSDFHFGHANIIDLCDRPFKNVDIMDRQLIKNINTVCDKEDTLYIVGDLTMKTRQHKGYLMQLLDKINPKMHLILGNHDYFNPFTYVECGIWTVHTALVLENENIAMVHDPAVSIVDPTKLWLCGHVHGMFAHLTNKDDQVSVINVGVDVWDFCPVSLTEIREYAEKEGETTLWHERGLKL